MASPPPTLSQTEAASAGSDALTISCNRCRRIKLRCSRDRPACAHCNKAGHDCVYEGARGKPGVKAGAIENIHRRLDQLESRLLRQESKSDAEPYAETSVNGHGSSRRSALGLLATELLKLSSSSQDGDESPQQGPQQGTQRTNKRRRVESLDASNETQQLRNERPPMPPPEMLDAIIRTYFTHIQPWIPMLHIEIFPQKLKTLNGLRKQLVLVHAISLAVEPHLPPRQGSLPLSSVFDQPWPAERVRKWVVSKAMEDVTLEGLQALTIVAFNDIGNGNASRAWSLIASLSRTVEFAQLTVDDHQNQRHQLICRPYTSLEPASDWTEQEERRRVFWNVFLLDRLCSTMMGWTTSLKSIEVHQRLPCDGGLWRRQEGGLTPYLGIWDKSTGGATSKSSYWVPGGGAEESVSPLGSDPWTQQPGGMSSSPSDQRNTEPLVDMSRVGAFGYCIEATESLSRVVSCFLQQRVNIDDPAEVTSWLGRFKELDMRLVHWRMFLPQKWKTNVPPTTPSGEQLRIDPNLTLAHVTHNTSTILLHQVLAYPPEDWPFRKRLPSGWSADTCCLAGAEIATIAAKYLEVTPTMLPVTSSFAFCIYIAARMMIVHWRFEEDNKLMDEFWALIRCLEEMSRRWKGLSTTQRQAGEGDLAARYARKLRDLCRMCSENPSYRILVSDYTSEIDYQAPPEAEPDDSYYEAYNQLQEQQHGQPDPTYIGGQGSHAVQAQTHGSWAPGPASGLLTTTNMMGNDYAAQHASQSDAASTLPATGQGRGQMAWGQMGPPASVGNESMQGGDDMMMRFMNDSFMDMDRVIAFNEGGLFTTELEHAVW